MEGTGYKPARRMGGSSAEEGGGLWGTPHLLGEPTLQEGESSSSRSPPCQRRGQRCVGGELTSYQGRERQRNRDLIPTDGEGEKEGEGQGRERETPTETEEIDTGEERWERERQGHNTHNTHRW